MLHKQINNRLRSGALVVLVEEPDELLALESAKVAAQKFKPVEVISAAQPDVIQKIEDHKTREGTLIVCDFLRVYGSNPVAVRLIREIALQLREKGPYARLILLEMPGIEVPVSLRTDIEYLIPKLPDVNELRQELDSFIKQHDEMKLEGGDETLHALACSVAGLARHEAARLFARCWIEKGNLDAVWLRREKAERVAERLGGALTFVDTSETPNVGGLGGLKKWLATRKDTFGSEKARKYGLPEPKGVLVLGIPGTGKSLTTKTGARDWGLPLLRLDAGKLFGSLVGQSESQTRQAIDAAEACSPCILWIDEIEKGFSSRGGLDGGTSQRVFGTLLTWLQEKTKPVFVFATANKVSDLPPELLRKGRFDEIFFVDLPTQEERVEIAKIHLLRHGRKPAEIKPDEIARACDGFSGAEIEQAIVDGMFKAYSEGCRDVRLSDILAAARATKPLSQIMSAEIAALKSWANGRARHATLPTEVQPSKDGAPSRARATV